MSGQPVVIGVREPNLCEISRALPGETRAWMLERDGDAFAVDITYAASGTDFW